MKFNLNTEIFDAKTRKLVELAGQKVEDGASPISRIFCALLLNGIQEERVAVDVKGKRYSLLCKIGIAAETEDKIVELTVDDLAIIKSLIDANCPTLIYGRITEIINTPISEGV